MKNLKQFYLKFVKKIHPDLFSNNPTAFSANSKSLTTLNSLLNTKDSKYPVNLEFYCDNEWISTSIKNESEKDEKLLVLFDGKEEKESSLYEAHEKSIFKQELKNCLTAENLDFDVFTKSNVISTLFSLAKFEFEPELSKDQKLIALNNLATNSKIFDICHSKKLKILIGTKYVYSLKYFKIPFDFKAERKI